MGWVLPMTATPSRRIPRRDYGLAAYFLRISLISGKTIISRHSKFSRDPARQ
jgi:hypothetical protein